MNTQGSNTLFILLEVSQGGAPDLSRHMPHKHKLANSLYTVGHHMSEPQIITFVTGARI